MAPLGSIRGVRADPVAEPRCEQPPGDDDAAGRVESDEIVDPHGVAPIELGERPLARPWHPNRPRAGDDGDVFVGQRECPLAVTADGVISAGRHDVDGTRDARCVGSVGAASLPFVEFVDQCVDVDTTE